MIVNHLAISSDWKSCLNPVSESVLVDGASIKTFFYDNLSLSGLSNLGSAFESSSALRIQLAHHGSSTRLLYIWKRNYELDQEWDDVEQRLDVFVDSEC